MKQAILGKKIGMTQLFREDGTMIPVTVVLAGPCPVTQVKTVEHDGYDAVQMAFQPVREKLITKPQMGHLRKAGRPIPPEEFYEDFDQLENGVGMMRLYASEFLAELEKPHRIYGTKKMDVVTGEMASPLIRQMMAELHRQYPMVEVTVHTIKNKFFGGNVGVAGLVTATDIIAQCEGRLTSGTLGVPAVMLREEKDTFLDDITIDQLAQRLGVKVEVLPTSGGDEARALLRSGLHIARRRRA